MFALVGTTVGRVGRTITNHFEAVFRVRHGAARVGTPRKTRHHPYKAFPWTLIPILLRLHHEVCVCMCAQMGLYIDHGVFSLRWRYTHIYVCSLQGLIHIKVFRMKQAEASMDFHHRFDGRSIPSVEAGGRSYGSKWWELPRNGRKLP